MKLSMVNAVDGVQPAVLQALRVAVRCYKGEAGALASGATTRAATRELSLLTSSAPGHRGSRGSPRLALPLRTPEVPP
jgi:hypothetical protein